jgi:hypothetical protein
MQSLCGSLILKVWWISNLVWQTVWNDGPGPVPRKPYQKNKTRKPCTLLTVTVNNLVFTPLPLPRGIIVCFDIANVVLYVFSGADFV